MVLRSSKNPTYWSNRNHQTQNRPGRSGRTPFGLRPHCVPPLRPSLILIDASSQLVCRAAEEIVAKLRQVDVLLSQGRSVGEAVRTIGVTQFTYYRWRKEFGGLKGDQVKRLKELEKENDRLRKAVSDLTLEKLILREAASGNY